MESYLLHINLNAIEFHMPQYGKQSKLWSDNQNRFVEYLKNKLPNGNDLPKSEGHPLKIFIELDESHKENSELPKLTLDTDESYHLNVSATDNHEVLAHIKAQNYYGARHALETLNQLIVYDDIRRELQILAKVSINDKPAFPWRGLLLDTSRNFYSIKAIKRTLGKFLCIQFVNLKKK